VSHARIQEQDAHMAAQSGGSFRMSEELVLLLRQRVADRYYENPQVVDIIARAILHSRGLYP